MFLPVLILYENEKHNSALNEIDDAEHYQIMIKPIAN